MNGGKERQAQLQRQHDALRRQQHALLESSSDAIISTDSEFVILGWNPAAEELHGWNADEALGKPLGALFASPDEERARQAMKVALSQDDRWTGVTAHTQKSGDRIRVRTTASLLRDEEDRPVSVVLVQRGVSDCAGTEAELRRAVRDWQVAFDSTRDAIWILDHEQRVLRYNTSAERMFPTLAEAPAGRHCWEIVHGTDRPIEHCPIHAARVSLQRESEDLPMLDGWYRVTTDPILDEDGAFAGAVHIVSDISKAKDAADRLQKSESKFRSITESSPDAIFILTPEGNYRYANPAATSLLGYSLDEFLGLNVGDLSDPIQAPSRKKKLQEEGHLSTEIYLRRKDGSRVDVDLNAVVLPNGLLYGSCRDLSERRAAEQDLNAAREFTETALDAQLDTFFLFDAGSGKAIRWNRAFREVSGYSDDEIAKLPAPSSYYGAEDLVRARAFIADVLKEGTGSIVLDLLTKDGRKIPTEYRVSLVTATEGEPTYIISVGRDITERKKIEDALRESETHLRAVFSSTPDLLMLLDREHRIQMINRAEPGLTEEQILGQALCLFAGADQARVRAHLDRVVDEAIRQQYATRHERPDGTTVHFNSVAAPVIVDGEVIGTVVSARDVTDRIKLEEDKERLEEQVRQSHKMEAVGRLAGGVAHDFNNLLTVINSYAGMADEELREGDPLKADIQEILVASERASGLTRQLLAFSRKQVMQPRVIDLNEVVAELEKMLRRLIGEDIEFHTMLAKRVGRINADPSQIQQLLMNLAINARDAMPEGGILTIETKSVYLDAAQASMRPDTKPGSYVMLAVSDDGHGISPELKERIFEPFFTTKEQGQGTGLGLAMVYGIVKQSGGSISVESEPGEGTTFQIYLPAVDEEMSDPLLQAASVDLRGNETVLVVEDERAVRNLVSRILTSSGYTVVSEPNGAMALHECELNGTEYDLVLTDVVMPQMNGRDLANRLAVLFPNLKVLFMSGYTDDALLRHGVIEEGTHFIAKPFKPMALLQKVRQVLDGK